MVYSKGDADAVSEYGSSVYYRRASSFSGLANATETELMNNFTVGIDIASVAQSVNNFIIVTYNKQGYTTFAYKTSSDDGVTWDTEVIVSTSLGDGNIIYDELSNRINGITNIWNGDQYTPYMYRAPYRGHNDSASGGSAGGGSYVHHIVSDGGGFVSRGTGSGCPSCGSLSWRSLVLDPKHPQGKRIHPGPQAAGNPLENDDPEGRGPHYFKCAQCGYIINTDNIQ